MVPGEFTALRVVEWEGNLFFSAQRMRLLL